MKAIAIFLLLCLSVIYIAYQLKYNVTLTPTAFPIPYDVRQTNIQDTNKTLWRSNSPIIKILFYTNYFGNKPWWRFHQQSSFINNSRKVEKVCGCSLKGCEISYDQSQYSTADLVFFHGGEKISNGGLTMEEMEELSRRRKANQLWVYFRMERPLGIVEKVQHLFNLSVTYRYSSDFPFPYGRYLKKNEEINRNFKEHDYTTGKSMQMAWLVSDCGKKRDKLAHHFEELGIHIDVFGKCNNRFQRPFNCSQRNCLNELRQYKFYFAAENGLCNQYITEKYWKNTFQINAIPITLGGSNYSDPRLAIPGSYINAMDFPTPQHLVNYIKKVDTNKTLYNEYFKWKKKFKLFKEKQSGCSTFLCDMCSKLKKGIKLKTTNLHFDIDRIKECRNQENAYDDWIDVGKRGKKTIMFS